MKNYLKEYQTIMMLVILFTAMFLHEQQILQPVMLIILILVALVINYSVLYLTYKPYDRHILITILKVINEISIWIAVANLIILGYKFINNPSILYTWWFIPLVSILLITFRYWFRIYKNK